MFTLNLNVLEHVLSILNTFADSTVFKIRSVVVECKSAKLAEEVFQEVIQYNVDAVVKEVFKRFNIPTIPTHIAELVKSSPRLIPRFNMFSITLPIDVVEMLMDDRRVVRVYNDYIVTTVEEGVGKTVEYTYPTCEKTVSITNFRTMKKLNVTTIKYLFKPLGVDKARKLNLIGSGVKIAVVDTGVSRVLPGIRDKVVYRDNLIEFEPADVEGHGTAVASTIAYDHRVVKRVREESFEIEGVAPGVEIVDIKALGYGFGVGKVSDVIKGIEIALQQRVDIINLSLGVKTVITTAYLDPFSKVVKDVVEEGVLIIAASGNNGPEPSTITSPGIYPEVLTVGAYNPIIGKVCKFSSRGPAPGTGVVKPDCVAPGEDLLLPTQGVADVLTDGVPNIYSPLSGTSFATPIASGLVALMMEFHKRELGKKLTRDELFKILEEFKDHEKNNEAGWGAITFDKYLKWVETQYGIKPKIE